MKHKNHNAKNGDWLAVFKRACTRFSLHTAAIAFFLLISCSASAQNAQDRPKLTEEELDQQTTAANHKRKQYTDGDWFLIAPGDTFDLLTSNNRRYYLQVYFSDEQLFVDIFRNDIFFKSLSIGENTLQGESIFKVDDFAFQMDRFNMKKRSCQLSIEGGKIPKKRAQTFSSNYDDWEDDNWETDNENYSDPFGHIMHAALPLLQVTDGKLTKTDEGWKLQFMLAATFENYEDEEVEELELSDAWVYVSLDGGVNWKTVHLDHFDIAGDDPDKQWSLPTMKRKEPYSHWMATLYLTEEEISDQKPIVYFFGAKDLFGNISMELPETETGYLPDPNYLIPAATDEDNPEDVVPGKYDILNTYIGRDNENLYLASQYQDNIDIGSVDPPSASLYIAKFTNPKKEKHEGLLVGKYFVFGPLMFSTPGMIDIETQLLNFEGAGRLMDQCIGTLDGGTNDVLIGRKSIYYGIKLKDICPEGCDSLRVVHLTAANNSTSNLMPIPYNCSPYVYVFFRSHSIDSGIETRIASPVVPDNGLEQVKQKYPQIDYDNYLRLMKDTVSEKQFIDMLKKEYHWEKPEQTYSIDYNYLTPEHITYYHEGPGPFYVTPCDIVKYKNYTLEIYTRNKNLKARIFRGGELLHTIMINEHTKPRRDEQHKTDDVYITLSDFYRKDMSCTIKIDDLK